MRHPGTVFAADDTKGIKGVFVLDDDSITLEVNHERWATWHVSLISLSEIAGNEYQFALNGDLIRFIPERRLDFAYGAVPALSKAQEDATKSFRARRKTKKAVRNVPPPGRHELAAPHPLQVASPATELAAASSPTPPAPQHAPQPTVPTPAKPVAAPSSSITDLVASRSTSKISAGAKSMPTGKQVDPIDPFGPPAEIAVPPSPLEPPSTENGELVIDLRTAADLSEVVDPIPTGGNNEVAPPRGGAVHANGHSRSPVDSKPEHRSGLRLLDRVRQPKVEHVHD
ncbi:MAG: hypothetical protein JJE47_11250, partial [Acidimicrobiia bacterium]|nr:hypothetical protein [Acidimicrobiia bacterium]